VGEKLREKFFESIEYKIKKHYFEGAVPEISSRSPTKKNPAPKTAMKR